MKNLAGDPKCDEDIRRELTRARVPIVPIEKRGEVPATLGGQLGAFNFRRAWYYWVVSGHVPLDVAREIYEDPVGRTDVRSGGDCACRPPETWATYYDADGLILESDPDGKEEFTYRSLIERGHLTAEGLSRIHFVPDKRIGYARAVVDCYHIDSEVGLRLFVDTLRAHGLEREGKANG